MLSFENEQSPLAEQTVGSIAIVRFSRPSQRNALSTPTMNALAASVERLRNNSSIRAVIFTGAADVFASGADINELAELNSELAYAFSKRGQEVAQKIADLYKITIAAINGYCMGGGLDLALACDIRIGSQSSVFAHPGSKLGIITGWGGTQRLPRLMGKSKAIELFSTARRFSSDEALTAGLITQIADPVLEAAIAIAKQTIATS